MQELRLTQRLLSYWQLVRKTSTLPEVQKFNVAAIEDVWPYCFLISVDTRGKSAVYKYEYMGKPIADLYGRDLSGFVVDQNTRRFPGKVIHNKFADILTERVPMDDDGHFVSEKGKMIKYRACILPLGNEKKGVTHIVVGLSCRAF